MNRHQTSPANRAWSTSGLSGACLLTLLTACADPNLEEGPAPAVELGSTADDATFEEYLATIPYDEELGLYIVESDLGMTEEDVRHHFHETQTASNALTQEVNFMMASRWSHAQKRNLTYCVANVFGNNQPRVIEAMQRATAAWEDAADVRFVYSSGQNGNCTVDNTNVVFNVVPWSSPTNAALAFYPHQARSQRVLRLNLDHPMVDSTWSLEGIVRHELGHILGFRHEHIRHPSAAGTACSEFNDDPTWQPVTAYDTRSVMHYPYLPPGYPCQGRPDTLDFYLSVLDMAGAAAVYDDPNAVTGHYTRIFARHSTSRELYERINGSWVRSRGATRTLVSTVDSTFAMDDTGIYRTTGAAGSGWTRIGNTTSHILRCSAYDICSTDGNYIYWYNNGNWTAFSTAGRKVVQAMNYLWAQTPDGENIYRSDGTVTSWVGGRYEDIIPGRTLYATSVTDGAIYSIDNNTNAVTKIGERAAQFLAAGSSGSRALFRMTPTKDSVYVYDYTPQSWSYAGGENFVRLYNAGFSTYAVDRDNVLWEYAGNYAPGNVHPWVMRGKP